MCLKDRPFLTYVKEVLVGVGTQSFIVLGLRGSAGVFNDTPWDRGGGIELESQSLRYSMSVFLLSFQMRLVVD